MEESTTFNNKGELYDFAFVIKRVDLLREAFRALSDKKLIRGRKAVIRVGKEGVRFHMDTSGGDGSGCLVFKAKDLEKFECKKPIQKAFSIKGMSTLFKSALKFGARSVFVFVVEGSNQLSFQWSEFGYGVPFHIDLEDPEHIKQGMSYRIKQGMSSLLSLQLRLDAAIETKSRPPSLQFRLAATIERDRTRRNSLQQPTVALLAALLCYSAWHVTTAWFKNRR